MPMFDILSRAKNRVEGFDIDKMVLNKVIAYRPSKWSNQLETFIFEFSMIDYPILTYLRR